MRKACIELNKTLKSATLIAGDLGSGRCLICIPLSGSDFAYEPTPQEWSSALDRCYREATLLKYEVTRVRGKTLTKTPE